MRGISWLAENRLASVEGLCCMEWVSITFRDTPLVLVDYTIQAMWSFCNSQLTVIMDRTTWTASGAEEMLLHVAIRSADRIIRLHLSVGTFNTCTAPTGMLKWLPGVLNYYLEIIVYNYNLHYGNTDCLICCCLQSYVSQACRLLTSVGKLFIISVS
jgi:hypothetical protein